MSLTNAKNLNEKNKSHEKEATKLKIEKGKKVEMSNEKSTDQTNTSSSDQSSWFKKNIDSEIPIPIEVEATKDSEVKDNQSEDVEMKDVDENIETKSSPELSSDPNRNETQNGENKHRIENNRPSTDSRLDEEDEVEISKIYSKFVFETKPVKNVNFNEQIMIKNITDTSDQSDTDEDNEANNEVNDGILDIEKAHKDKQLIEIINCKSQEDVEHMKTQLVSQIEALMKKKHEKIDIRDELKSLKEKITFLLKVSKKLTEEKDAELQNKSEPKVKNNDKHVETKESEKNNDKGHEETSRLKNSKSVDKQEQVKPIEEAKNYSTDWLFEHVYGDKAHHVLIYFDLPFFTWTKDNFQPQLLNFLQNAWFNQNNVKLSLIFQSNDMKFKQYDVEISKLHNLTVDNIHECLTHLNKTQNSLYTLVHVSNGDIKDDHFKLDHQLDMLVFGFKFIHGKSISKPDEFNIVTNRLSDMLNLNIFSQLVKLRKRLFTYSELLIFRRLASGDLSSYEKSKSLVCMYYQIPTICQKVQGKVISALKNHGEETTIQLFYNYKRANLNGKIVYEFFTSNASSKTIYWLEPVHSIDSLSQLLAQYECAIEYVEKYNEKKQANKIKVSNMFGVRDENNMVYFVNNTNEPLEKSNLQTHNDPDFSLKQMIVESFSHFTYEESKHKLVIIDLRPIVCYENVLGFRSIKYILITEPVVFSVINSDDYSAANLATKGIESFCTEHKCNQFCSQLQLTPFK